MQSRFGSFALVGVLLLLAGCSGSSPSTVQAQSGSSFSNATISGTYGVALSGTEGISTGQIAEFDIAANLVANGAGQISGTYSEFINYLNNQNGVTNATGNCTGTVSGGTYSFNSVNGSGSGTANLTFVPSSTQSCIRLPASYTFSTNVAGSTIVFAEMDGIAVSSGTGILQ